MAHSIARARVADFERFIKTFGSRGKAKRSEHGSRGAQVFRGMEDPNEVIILFDWNQEEVRSFLADPETKDIMAEAGVEGAPEFTHVEHHSELDA